MSIKTKMAWTVFLLVASLMAILTLAGYHYLAHTFKEALSRQNEAIVETAARHIDDDILHSQQMLALIAGKIDPEQLADPAGLQSRLDKELSARTFFDGGFQILDAEARIVAESPALPQRKGVRLQGRDYVAMGIDTGKPYISAPYLSGPAPGRPTITFCVPILRRDGSVAGLLAGHNDLLKDDSMTDFGQLTVGKNGTIFMIERNRTIIMHSDRRRIMERLPPGNSTGLDHAMRENPAQPLEGFNDTGGVEITAARRLKHAAWFIVSQYPVSEAYAPLDHARFSFAAALAVTLGLTLLALRVLIRRITAPLVELTGHVRDLPAKVGAERLMTLKTGDEVEALALAVNDMVGQMERKQELLRENQELYRVIADFTSELALLQNSDDSIRYISANCLALTGYTDREFQASPQLLEGIIHPEDSEAWSMRVRCGKREPSGTPIDLRLVTKGGEERWFNYTCHEVTGADGACLGIRGSFRDISQRRELERKLDEQRQFAENLLASTSTPLFAIDAGHRVIIWNRAMVQLTGIEACEVLGTDHQWRPFYGEQRPTLSDLVLDQRTDEIGDYYNEFEKDLVLQGIIRAEGWFQNLNGKERHLLLDAAPVQSDGRVVAVVETLYDITARTRAEESLRLLAQAVEQTASSIVITDPAGNMLYVNNKFCETSGYDLSEVIGKSANLLKSGAHQPQLYAELWEAIGSGREWHGEFHNRRKDGTLFWESAIISPITDYNGAISNYLAVKEEITSRKHAERQLQKKQAELVLKHEQLTDLFRQVEQGKREWEQTMDCIDDMVAMVDNERRIKRCNRAFMKFAGCSYPQMISTDWYQLLKRAGLDLDSLQGLSGELFHPPSQRWLTVKTYPYDDGRGEVITLHDLTQIKQVSEQLTQAYEELKATHSQLLQQEKMASIGQLAAGVAHEINNPMGFISSNLGTMGKYLERLTGFLELQSAGIEEHAPEKLREEIAEARRRAKVDYILDDCRSLLAESQDGAERVRTIVQNLKSFSRADEGRASYVDLNECLESTVTIAWNELKYKTTLKRDYGELPQVKCLPQQLNQVFLNLLVNAAHAIEKQGEVTIRTRRDNDQVTVAIHDTGCGIPEANRNRIFEPFFTTKEVGKGTGLGLSISYDIIKKHGGNIEVESEVGMGTTFTIILPIEGVQP
ncbi:MAG: histidine kinase [Geobacteraceae bacterium GWC2_58_44]|nr:MAG: histidine kinase [Geobacteraceae bacterium GWC2_58_44]